MFGMMRPSRVDLKGRIEDLVLGTGALGPRSDVAALEDMVETDGPSSE
jgi:hypothetical protein